MTDDLARTLSIVSLEANGKSSRLLTTLLIIKSADEPPPALLGVVSPLQCGQLRHDCDFSMATVCSVDTAQITSAPEKFANSFRASKLVELNSRTELSRGWTMLSSLNYRETTTSPLSANSRFVVGRRQQSGVDIRVDIATADDEDRSLILKV